MSTAQALWLFRIQDALAKDLSERVVARGDYQHRRRIQPPDRVYHIPDHGVTQNVMENFRHRAFHPGPKSSAKDHGLNTSASHHVLNP